MSFEHDIDTTNEIQLNYSHFYCYFSNISAVPDFLRFKADNE